MNKMPTRPFGVTAGLAAAQLRRIGLAGCAAPVAAGALIAFAGVVLAGAVGMREAEMALLALAPLHSLVVGLAVVSLLADDALAELQGSTPIGFRAVQAVRAALIASAGAVGGLALFMPLSAIGLACGAAGWSGVLVPVGGAAVLALAAFAFSCVAGSARSAALSVTLVWMALSFFWDPNLAGDPVLQRVVPLALASAGAVGAWLSLGDPERALSKAVGAR